MLKMQVAYLQYIRNGFHVNNHGGGIMENTKTEEQDIVVVAEADIQFMNLSTSHDTCSCRCINHCSCDCDRCSWHTVDS